MGKFYAISCGRTVAEQRLIRAKLDLWKTMPEAEKNGVSALIAEIARGGVERAALEAVLIRNVSPRVAAERWRMDRRRVYAMQKEFLEKVKIWG